MDGWFDTLEQKMTEARLAPDQEEELEHWLDAFEEFCSICMRLREAGRLPDTFKELAEFPDAPDGLESLYTQLLPNLFINSRFEEVCSVCGRLVSLFPDDRDLQYMVCDVYPMGLMHTGRLAEAESFLRSFLGTELDRPAFRGLHLSILAQMGDFERGDAIYAEYDEPGLECGIDTLFLFQGMKEYQEAKGNSEEANRLEQIIKDTENRLSESMFGSPAYDPEAWDARSGQELVQQLCRLIDLYTEDQSAMINAGIASLLTEIAALDLEFYPVTRTWTGIEEQLFVTDEEEKMYPVFYTCKEAAERDGSELSVGVPFSWIVEEAEESGYAGIVLDPLHGELRFSLSLADLQRINAIAGDMADDDGDTSGLLS